MLKKKQLNEALNYKGQHPSKQRPKEMTLFSLESCSTQVFRGLLEVKVDMVESSNVKKTCSGSSRKSSSHRIAVCLTPGADRIMVCFVFTSKNPYFEQRW